MEYKGILAFKKILKLEKDINNKILLNINKIISAKNIMDEEQDYKILHLISLPDEKPLLFAYIEGSAVMSSKTCPLIIGLEEKGIIERKKANYPLYVNFDYVKIIKDENEYLDIMLDDKDVVFCNDK